MPELGTSAYERQWSPREYLRQYYATPHVHEDERANIAFARRLFARARRWFNRAVEIGCGPTLHHALLLAPHVEQLWLADYLPANLEEVRRSLTQEPGSHDWRVFSSGVRSAATPDPWHVLRQRVAGLLEVDVRSTSPLGAAEPFDLIASYYCIECAVEERGQWRRCLANVAGLVAPGGVLLLGVLRRCREYHVLGRTFPTVFVDEADFAAELPALGFDPVATVIEVVPVVEWVNQGFESICCVWAVKYVSNEVRVTHAVRASARGGHADAS